MSDLFFEVLEAAQRNPNADSRETYKAVQSARLEEKRANEERAVTRLYEDNFGRVLREIAESAPAAGNTRFQATRSEIELAKARNPGATETVLIAAIRERREWETAHPNWINEAAARSPKAVVTEAWARAPKAAHGPAVSRSTRLAEPSQSRRESGTIDIREQGNPNAISLAEMWK